jgi:hypothetical protein
MKRNEREEGEGKGVPDVACEIKMQIYSYPSKVPSKKRESFSLNTEYRGEKKKRKNIAKKARQSTKSSQQYHVF